MAAKFVVAVALFGLCHANPVLYNGVLARDGRAYAVSQAANYNNGGSLAQANVRDDLAQAYGSSNDGSQWLRDGSFPGQANALARTDGAGQAFAQAQNQGGYYHVPAPATIVAYEQKFAVPTYAIRGVDDGASDSSSSSATTNGEGVAESSAQTKGGSGSYGETLTNAKTYGIGSASSDANSGLNSASTSAKSQGNGAASSSAETNRIGSYVPIYNQEQVPENPIFYTAYVPKSPVASSNANVNGFGQAASSAKTSYGRTISWRFGTLYDNPDAAYALAKTNGYGSANSAASTNGYGSANSAANANSYGSAKSAANANGYGSANANADVNGGAAKSSANTNGAGSAIANADVNGPGYGAAKSAANTNSGYGSASSTANVHGSYGVSKTSADTRGYGNASSSARTQAVSTTYRVNNSQASSRLGSAHANAQIV